MTERTYYWLAMSMYRLFCLFAVFISISDTQGVAKEDEPTKPLQFTLPSMGYAVVGVLTSIYYDNLILTEKPEQYRFQIESDFGTGEARRWTVTPTASDVGNHEILVSVSDLEGKRLEHGKLIVHVAPADAGVGQPTRLLLVGDSLTHDPRYPNEMARLLSEPGNPTWTMLGTHRPSGVAERVMHEGYGGWTWEQFVKHWAKQKPTVPADQGNGNPLAVAVDANGPTIDLDQYFHSSCGGHRPDYVILLLGINDCFHVDPNNSAAIDARISVMFTHADRLIAAFRKSAPKAELGIGLTTPPNSRESGFEANYHGQYHRWGWKCIQHRLVQRELEHFDGRQAEQIYIIPTELNLDPIDGFPVDNGVHPNDAGYQQIAATVFAWLKSRLEASQP